MVKTLPVEMPIVLAISRTVSLPSIFKSSRFFEIFEFVTAYVGLPECLSSEMDCLP